MRDKIRGVILQCVQENLSYSGGSADDVSDSTPLRGEQGLFDSMALITLLTDIEQKISDELDVNIAIADENAFSEKQNPFRDTDSLTDYIMSKIEKQGHD